MNGISSGRQLAPGAMAYPLLIVALGFALRLVNLGHFDFWFDEVGQVLVGREPSPVGAIQVAASHLGAAPLDYVVTWFGVRLLGESEFALRWLPVCWSTLSVAILFAIGERLEAGLGKRAALLAALSPLAIRHAQEVRFYSLALMLAALILWWGLQGRKVGREWTVGLALLMALGLYAHAYTMLLWPFVAWALLCAGGERRLALLLQFGLAAGVAFALFAPWFFGELLTEQAPYFPDAAGFNLETARRVLVGWEMPNFSVVAARNTASQPLPYVIALLHIAALWLATRNRRESPLWIGMLATYFAATGVVVLNDMRVGYFFAPRQILNLLPLRALFCGWVTGQVARASLRQSRWRSALLVAGLVAVALPSLAGYYNNWRDKSNAAQVADLVVAFPPDRRWIAPGYDQLTLNYYLERAGQEPHTWRVFLSAEAFNQQAAAEGTAIVVLQSAYATAETLKALDAAGFSVLWPPGGVTGNEHFVALGRD